MSTRSSIVVVSGKSKPHYVYHHCDGYLEGVGKWLKEFIKDTYSPVDHSAEEFCSQLEDWDDQFEFEDHGIHGDEEYIYYVNIGESEVTVEVEGSGDEEEEEYKETIKITP